MKTLLKLTTVVLILLLFTSFSEQTSPETFSLTVKVDHLKNSKGVVQFTLYNKDGSIPDEKFKKFFLQKKAVINHQTSEVTFTDLPAGRYAVNILHDENENGKIDKKFVLPKEGIGFSNYSSIGLTNRPSFSKASFKLDTDKEITVKIIYM